MDIENIPSHNHEFTGDLVTDTISQDNNRCGILRQDKRSGILRSGGWKGRRIRDEGGTSYDLKVEYKPSGKISYTGGSRNNKHTTKPFTIMPPYYKVYCWRRTAL